MKPLFISAAALFAAVAFVRADLVVVQKVEGGGQGGDQTIKIKGDKSRTELSPGVSMITDGATGEIVTLMSAGRTYLKVPAAQTKAMMEQLQKFRTGPEPAKLEPAGKTEKIGEYDCEIFTATMGLLKTTYWLAKDFPNFQSVLAQIARFQAGTISAMGHGLMPELKDFPGMPIKTEMDLGGKKIITTLVSVKEENVDPGVFNIPKDYKEITSPTLNFQPK